MEYEMFGERIPNLEAQVLAELYNPAHAGSFMALLHAHKHPQMRFLIRPQGAIPSMGPEEVALINVDPGDEQDGIWYMSHTVAEIRAHTYSSNEEKHVIAPEHYDMDVHVGKNDHLAAKATLRFKAVRDGDRVIAFRSVFLERRKACNRAGTLRHGRSRGKKRPSRRQGHLAFQSRARRRSSDRLPICIPRTKKSM